MVAAQLECYRAAGFPERHGLIETNLMFFDLRNGACDRFLDAWWDEIERFSHRDQLSVNFALWKTRTRWQPIFSERRSLRDASGFRYFGHGRNSGYVLEEALS
jgi:O-antigen biosynthesis protein